LVLMDERAGRAIATENGLQWLQSLFGTVWVPIEVHAEVLSGFGSPDEQSIGAAVSAGWLRLCGPTTQTPLLPELDERETACIRLALAHTGASLLLMDERAGRAIAMENGLQVAGTAAVIGMARLTGLIPSAKDVFAHLHASDFRISAAVIRTILERVGEE